ncbi:MAG: alpha/beta fold hydrolase [Gaiellaceae bacterium MAG52_C11]|nr:alpha/beta fold hydrolase [Candidatus Gaiellasilicea maunaloa]
MTSATHIPPLEERLGLEERRALVAGVELRYFTGGEGDPLVLVHGLGGSAANWVELLAAASARYRVLVLDLPGHGGSGRAPRGAGMSHFADVVAGLIEHEGAAPALVAGHSLGGLVTLRLAHRRPELVRALLLAAPAGIATRTRAAQRMVILAGLLRPGRWVAPFRHRYAERVWYRRMLFQRWFVADPLAFSARATLGFLEGPLEHVDTRTAARAMLADDPRLDLEHVHCPSIVLWGARDPQLPLDDAFEYARRLRARLRVVADCGHLVIGERAEACLDALVSLEESTP